MAQQSPLTTDNLPVVLLVIAVAIFFGIGTYAQNVLKDILESATKRRAPTGALVQKCARATYASAIITLGEVFLGATATLVVGLGLSKTALPWISLFLPDKTLGLAVLLSYSGLVTAVRAVSPELNAARKKIFR